MKWFNLSLLLVVVALTVVVLVEPVVLNNFTTVTTATVEPLPDSINNIQTLDELSTPLTEIPGPGARSANEAVPVVETPVAAVSGNDVLTRKLENPVFAGESLDQKKESEVIAAVDPENPAETTPAQNTEPEVEANPVAASEPVINCYRYGPLKDFDQVAAAGDLMVKRGYSSGWDEVEEPFSEPRYWVVLDVAETRQQARDWVKKLDEKKFGDHYLPLNEEEPHLISLGIFKTSDRARRHLDSLTKAGFPVKLRPKPVELSRRWVRFDADAESQPAFTDALTGLGLTDSSVQICSE